MLKLLKAYKKRLANLTSKNRSLLLLKPSVRHFFDIHNLNFINEKTSFSVITDLLSSKNRINLCPQIDPRDGKSNELSKNLNKIRNTDQLLQSECGSEDLHLGYPFIQGKLLDGTPIRCPLLFFPVRLTPEDNMWRLEKKDSGITLNRTFLIAYSHFNKSLIDEEFFESSFDEFGSEPKTFLTQLYEFLKQSKLEINFNSDLFLPKLETFETLKKEDLDNQKNGELKLMPQAVLGIFPQAGSYIAADYEELISENVFENFSSLEEFLFQNEELTDAIKEENMHLPLAVDSSQEEAIKQIKSGKSMVIQGPPGTGKSQLICNLMADYAAEGKKVLLVCQKRTAIDTVYNRLSEIGMENFAALVHDFQVDRKPLYQKVASQIENILPYKHENQSLNAIFLEREFSAVCRKTDQILRELADFKTALFDANTYGKSIKELYLLAENRTQKELDLKDSFPFFHFSTIDAFLQKLDTLERFRKVLIDKSIGSSFWQKRKLFSDQTPKLYSEIKDALEQISELKKGLGDFQENFLLDTNFEQSILARYFEIINTQKRFQLFQTANSGTSIENVKSFIHELASFEGLDSLSKTYSVQELRGIRSLLEQSQNKTPSILSYIFWKLFSKDRELVFNHLRDFNLKELRSQMPLLIKRVGLLLRLHEIANQVGFISNEISLESLSSELNELYVCQTFHYLFSSVSKISASDKEKVQFEAEMNLWKSLLERIETNKEKWNYVLSPEQIEILQIDNFVEIDSYLDNQFDNLLAKDKLFSELTAIEKRCYRQVKERFKDSFAFNFQQNLIVYFIEDLEEKNPILRSASSIALNLWEAELQALILKKQKFSRDYLLMKLRENTYHNIEKNRLGNPTTYRDLQHQTTKKRQLWPVRKLLQNFSHELFDLVPCWMASPETVSAIFPLNKEPLFDLIIFDEASQCFAEQGLAAMLRGKQIVIAGDSQQLQPNDLYKVKLEEESDDDPLLEKESLLDLGVNILSHTTLRGHYRSKSLDLIDFSNQYFYKNKLKLLPDFNELNEALPAIEFIKVSGVWEDNQNISEAEKILEVVSEIRKKQPDKTLAVVTFNFQQAELIQELTQHLSNVVVKNIENIQGDEFDIVIFSIGYAPDSKGKLRMNFGSLNQKGGENRLNVAITRAKEKIKVVSSILPEDLSVENSSNEGPKLLKAYLQYAKRVSDGFFKPSLPRINDTIWTRQLKNEISRSNPAFSNSLPFADLVLKKDEKYSKIILTDDQQFYGAESLKESFAYLPQMLEKKGWKYQKVWSRNWWLKPLSELHLLEEKPEKL